MKKIYNEVARILKKAGVKNPVISIDKKLTNFYDRKIQYGYEIYVADLFNNTNGNMSFEEGILALKKTLKILTEVK